MQPSPVQPTQRPHWKASRPPPRNGVPPSVLHLPKPCRHALLLDQLAEQFAHITRAAWMQRMRQQLVLAANGTPLAPNAPTPAGQWIWYYRMPASERPIPVAETVLFQDEWLVVADKPHFLPVAPSGRYAHETLLARLQRRLQLPHLAPLHRLDRETAGLVIFTVQAHTRDAYARLFRTHSIRKTYEAIATCNPALDLRQPLLHASHLAPHAHDFFRMAEYAGKASNSSTLIEALEHLPQLRVRLRLQPHTGLRHQLRVHLHALGMPIVGDRFYPHVLRSATAEDDYENPLQLLAQHLAFTDPITRQARQFSSRLRLGNTGAA